MKERVTSLKSICLVALGIALYVVVSMLIKIPIPVGHLSLDCGYIVLAVFCYSFGPLRAAIVGAAGCTIVSLLASGWFPPGWMIGNFVIGLACGKLYEPDAYIRNILVTVISVTFGIFVLKTLIECGVYSIPIAAKVPGAIAGTIVDAVVMSIGVVLAPVIDKRIVKAVR